MSKQTKKIQHDLKQLHSTCEQKRGILYNRATKQGIWRRHSQVTSGFTALLSAFLAAGGVHESIGPTVETIWVPVLAGLSGLVSLLTSVYLANTDTLFEGASQFLVLRESVEVALDANEPVTLGKLPSFKARYADVATKYDRYLSLTFDSSATHRVRRSRGGTTEPHPSLPP